MKQYLIEVDGLKFTVRNLDNSPLNEQDRRIVDLALSRELNPNAWVYIAERQNIHKIGLTFDVERRMSELKANLIHTIGFKSYRKARRAESVLLDIYTPYKVTGEWFNLPQGEIEELKKISISEAYTLFDAVTQLRWMLRVSRKYLNDNFEHLTPDIIDQQIGELEALKKSLKGK